MSNDTPHIIIDRETSSFDNWCVHYAGLMKNVCDAGVEYESVKKNVQFTYERVPDKHRYIKNAAYPCFKRENHLTDGCAKCRFPTPEETKAHESELDTMLAGVSKARLSIVEDLEKRHASGDSKVKFNKHSDVEVEDGDTNFVSGVGKIGCPVCLKGELQYSRASYNGHIHARCSTDGCVSWME